MEEILSRAVGFVQEFFLGCGGYAGLALLNNLIRLPSNKQRLKIKIKNPRWVRSEDSRCDFGPADRMLSNGTYVQN